MAIIKTKIKMIITTITIMKTNNNKNNNKEIKRLHRNKKTALISNISENFCPQNVPVL